jgi:hypothetical protein
VQVGQKQAVAAKKGLVVTVCVWAAYGECHAATAMVINCQLSAIMLSAQLCAVKRRRSREKPPALWFAAHNYRVLRNSSSESGARYRRVGVFGSFNRAKALSFIARSASTY